MKDLLSDVDDFLTHQANQTITEGSAKRILDPQMKRAIFIDRNGNI